MKFGVLKDIKSGEFRVVATPTEVNAIVSDGHEVCAIVVSHHVSDDVLFVGSDSPRWFVVVGLSVSRSFVSSHRRLCLIGGRGDRNVDVRTCGISDLTVIEISACTDAKSSDCRSTRSNESPVLLHES